MGIFLWEYKGHATFPLHRYTLPSGVKNLLSPHMHSHHAEKYTFGDIYLKTLMAK